MPRSHSAGSLVHGAVEPEFEAVPIEFECNFSDERNSAPPSPSTTAARRSPIPGVAIAISSAAIPGKRKALRDAAYRAVSKLGPGQL